MNETIKTPLFDKYFDGLEQQEAARASTKLILGTGAPDAAAEALSLGSELGVPPQAVQGAPEVFRLQAAQLRATTAIKAAPKLQDWLGADPINGAIAKDDLENLSWFGRGAHAVVGGLVASQKVADETEFVKGIKAGVSGAKGSIVAAATIPVAGFGRTLDRRLEAYSTVAAMEGKPDRYQIADALGLDPTTPTVAFAFMFSTASPEQRQRMVARELAGVLGNKETLSGLVDMVKGYIDQAQSNPGATQNFTDIDSIRSAADWFSYNSGQAVPYLAGLAAMGAIAGPVGLMGSGYALGAGDIQSELIKEGMDPAEAAAYSLAGGIPYAALEYLGPAAALTRGVRTKALQGVAESYFKRLGREVPKQAIEEFINEAGQEIIKDFTVAAATDKTLVLNEKTLLKWFNAGMAGAAGGVSFSAVTAAQSRVESDIDRAGAAGMTAERLAEIDRMAGASKVKARSPDRFLAAIEAAGADASMYVSADGLQEYFQAKDIALDDETLAAWGVDPADFAEKLSSGGDIAIPTANYAARISDSEHAGWVRENAVFDYDEMSVADAAEFNSRVRELMDEAAAADMAADETEQSARASDVQIYDQVFSDLRAAGRSPDVAKNEASVWSAFWRTMGERYGADPLELARSMGVSIRGPQSPDVARRRGEMDVMLNTLRAKGDKALKPSGAGILDFVKSLGGVRDRGGDVASMDAPKGLIAETADDIRARESQPGFAGSVDFNGKGRSLDEIGRALIEAGYFPEYMGGADIQADGTAVDEAAIALEAIAEAISGRDRHIEGQGPNQDLLDLSDVLSERGIDLSMSNDAIIAALNADPNAGPSYGQGSPDEVLADGAAEVGPNGLRLRHGSPSAGLNIDAVEIIRTGQKQGKKGRVYGGFYASSVADSSDAAGYASANGSDGTVYNVDIKPGIKVLQKDGDITRLSQSDIGKWVADGYGLVVGTDPRGRTEYVVIDKSAIRNISDVNSQDVEYDQSGKLITDSAAFKAWFGDSKVVDADGNPLVVYHGTASDFDAFDAGAEAKHIDLPGFYFTPDAGKADDFSASASRKEIRGADGYIDGYEGAQTLAVYLSIKNPVDIDASSQDGKMVKSSWVRSELENAQAAGHDGAVIRGWADGSGETQYVAFSPEQIKSVHNRGTFDASDPRILYQEMPGANLVTDAVIEFAQSDGVMPDVGLKVGKRARFWRGVNETSGGNSAEYGEGLYVAGSKAEAQSYVDGGGRLIEMDRADLPQNPIRFRDNLDWQRWRDRVMAEMGLRGAREYGPQFPDISQLIQRLYPDVDGVQLSTGKDAIFVNFGGDRVFEQDKRGSIVLPRGGLTEGQTVINLFESADLSTFLHESGHFFLEASMNLVSRPDAPLTMRNDMTAILRWLDVPASNGGAPQTIINRLQLHSKTLGNLTVGKSGLSKGEGGVSVEALLPMVSDMRRAVSDAKVLDAVIRALPVDVMDMLGGSEGAAKVALHDEAVLKSIFTSAAIKKENVSVPVDVALLSRQVDLLGKTLGVIADTAAKMTSVPLGPAGAEASDISASVAGNIGHDDFDALMEGWRQLSSDEKTNRHEKWARGSEAYFMEGNAPSLELASAFSRFKAWLSRIYRSIAGLNVKLNPQIREVMDRMLATDAEIAAMRDDLGMRPLFSEAPAGMSPADFATYQRLAQGGVQQAEAALLKRTMEKVRRETQAWFKEEKAAVRKEVEASANRAPVYRLVELLANQSWLGDAGKDAPDVRIDRQALVDQFGDGVIEELGRAKLGGKRAIYGPGGEQPGMVAEMFGFSSARDMIEALQNSGKRKDFIDGETDRIMLERHGDPLSDGSIEEAAALAVHSEQQASMVASEARTLAKRLGQPTRDIRSKVFRQRARAMIGRMSVKEASRPAAFLQAERKAARAAEQSFAKVARGGKGVEAALHAAKAAKEKQLLNSFLYQEARAFEAELQRGRERMQSYSKASVRKAVGLSYVDPVTGDLKSGHIEQIDAMLDRFDFRVRSEKQVQNKERLRDYIDRMIADGRGDELAIDERFMDESMRKHYTRLSVDDLRGLFDTIANIDHIGRRRAALVDRARKRDLNEVASKVSGLVSARFGSGKSDKQSGGARNFVNLLMRVDTISADIDKKEIGDFYDAIKRPIDEGSAIEQRMNSQTGKDIHAIFGVYTSKEKADFNTARVVPGGNGHPWTKQQILALALNTGNSVNRQRILDRKVHETVRLTESQLDATLETLDKRDWDFVQSVWDYVDTFKKEAFDTAERMTGIRPKSQDAESFSNKHGNFRGGYYPIAYDPTKSKAAAIDAQTTLDAFMGAGRGMAAKVGDGFTKSRQSTGGGRSLNYDFSVMMKHFGDSARLIALGEPVQNARRILAHQDVHDAFRDGGVADLHQTLDLFLHDVASGPLHNNDSINWLFRLIKNNFTLSRLAFNFKTVALQITGIGQSAAVIGKMNMLKGYSEYRKHPVDVPREIMAKSAYMAERQTTFQKDIFDQANELRLSSPIEGKGRKIKNEVSKWGFAPMIKVQFYAVDVPTWLGAYHAEIARNGGDDAGAIHFADRMVDRAQGGGFTADRNALERGTLSRNVRQADLVRVWTTLAGYMVTKMNRGYLTAKFGARDMSEAEGVTAKVGAAANMATDLIMLYVFEAAMMGIAYSLLADDEDDEDIINFAMKELAGAAGGGVPFVRESVGAFNGYGAGGVLSSVLEIPSNIWTQVRQGENDKAFRRSIADAIGFATGMPSTQSMRIIEELIEGSDGSLVDAAIGRNPLAP